MKSKYCFVIPLVLLIVSSLIVLDTNQSFKTVSTNGFQEPQSSHTLAEQPSIAPPSILVYTEFVDYRTDQEYENTMTAINNTYGTDYQQTNLTNYNNLDSSLPGKDILLIPEQELATPTTMKAVGAIWASTLTTFVHDGGVVILLDFGNVSAPGLGLHIYNESSLMQFGPVLGQYPSAALSEMHRHTFGDALSRRIEYRWTPQNHTFAVQTTDGVIAIDDYDTDSPIGVHKSMGKGHVVFLGFDMQYPDANQEQIVGNAIRFSNYVIIDDAQDTEATWEFPPPHIDGFALGAWVDDMVEDGFAVGRMDTVIDPTLLNASKVFICPIPYWTDDYNPAEIAIIDDYVTNGGSVFIISDWGGFGDEIEALANNFGYYSARDSLWDSDDSRISWPSQIHYTGDNIINHPITTNISRVEFYASDGFTALPTNAEKIIVSDWDGTASWGSTGSAADGAAAMAVSRYGSGKVCVVLDSNFMDGTEDTDIDSVDSYFDSDNSQILMNTVRWLAGGSPENDVPLITGLTHTPPSPLNGQPVTVDVNVADANGLSNITCHYRVNGGSWNNISMTPEGGDDYSADIGSFSEIDDVDYYIRVFDGSTDVMESVSSLAFFTVVNQFPTAPSLIDPGITDVDGNFAVTWSPSSDPDGIIDHYELQMSNSSSFIIILDEWNATTTSQDVTDLTNRTYYFRVLAVDDHNAISLWSNIESINVAIPIGDISGPYISAISHTPSVPIQGEEIIVSANVTDLSGVKNVTCFYRINSGAWQSVIMTNVGGDRFNASLGSFLVGDHIEFYVSAFDNSTKYNEDNSSISLFQIMNQPPSAPTLGDPGTTISVSHVMASWTSGSDPEGAIDHYQLEISISITFASVQGVWNTTSTDFNITDLANGVYYLRVRVFDDHNASSPWSNIESFEVLLDSTNPTSTPTQPTTTPTTYFSQEVMDLLLLVVTIGTFAIMILIIISYIRSRAQRRYEF